MTDQPLQRPTFGGPNNTVRYARRLVIRRPDHPDLQGIQFTSGTVVADDPENCGLIGAISVEALIGDRPGCTVHWADETTEEPAL